MEAIICAVISAVTTLIVSVGSFQVSVRKDREKAKEELKEELIKYHEKNREEIQKIREHDLREIRDDVSQMGANLQNKMALVELSMNHARNEIATLSTRVDKHNNFEGRIIALEDADKLLEEKIKVANARILDLEKRGGA